MRALAAVILLVALAAPACAQAPAPRATPEQDAAQYMINQLIMEKKDLLTQIITQNRQIEELKQQLADAQASAPKQ